MDTPKKEYLNQTGLCEHFGISAQTIIKLRKEGLPCLHISRQLLLFKVEEVEEWLKNRRWDEDGREESK
jgi:hypothetical protein